MLQRVAFTVAVIGLVPSLVTWIILVAAQKARISRFVTMVKSEYEDWWDQVQGEDRKSLNPPIHVVVSATPSRGRMTS